MTPRLNVVVPQPLPQMDNPRIPAPAARPPGPALPHVEVFRNAALSIANGFAFTNIPYDALDDTAFPASNAFDLTTGIFTCPLPGRYQVSAMAIFNQAGGYSVGLELLRNGAAYKRLGNGYNGVGNSGANGSVTARALTVGTTFQVQVAQNSAANPAALFVGSDLCYCMIEYLGPLL
jgi:hypothetical protein